MAGPIRIAVLADAAQARRELSGVANETSTLGSKLGKFGKAAGVAMVAGLAVAGAATVKFGADAVKAASDAQQSLGATETVFGKFSDTVIRTSEAAATKYGLSANVYRENANLLGSLFKNQGVELDQLGAKTEGMIGTAADLAATFGGTTTDAVQALGAAFKGEYDMLERYGISIKQSDVNARLAAKGQDQLTGAALKAAEQQAKSALIAEQAAQANGAFARETNTLAHQQQVLGAQFDNIKAKVGTALLPVLTTLLTFINANLLPAFAAIGEFLRPIIARFQEFFSGIGGGTSLMQPALDFINAQLIPGVMGIVTAFQNMLNVVRPIVQQIVAAITSQWGKIQPQVRAIWTSVQNIIKSALSVIKSVVQAATGAIRGIWQTFGATILRFITTTMRNVADLIRSVFKIIEGIFKVVSSALRGDWQGMWNGIKQIASGALGVLKAVISQAWNVIKTVTSAAWTTLKTIVSKAWDAVKNAVTSGIAAVMGVIRGLPGKITGALGDLGSLLYNAGKSIIQGLLDGIESMIGAVKDKLSALTDLIPDIKGPPAKDKVLLRPAGRLIMQGLIDGFDDGEKGVKRTLKRITGVIEGSDLAHLGPLQLRNSQTAQARTATRALLASRTNTQLAASRPAPTQAPAAEPVDASLLPLLVKLAREQNHLLKQLIGATTVEGPERAGVVFARALNNATSAAMRRRRT